MVAHNHIADEMQVKAEEAFDNAQYCYEAKDQLVVDSRIIAEELGTEHESFLKTVRKYQADIDIHRLRTTP